MKTYNNHGGRRRKRVAAGDEGLSKPIKPVKPSKPVEGSFQPLSPLTEADRRALRASQRVAGERDPDLAGYRRRRYEDQQGHVNYSEPLHRPPQLGRRKPMVNESDPDLSADVDEGGVTAGLDRIAVLDPNDAALNRLDQMMTAAFSAVRNLKEAADSWLRTVESDGDAEVGHASERISWIAGEALLPWLNEIDQHLDQVLAGMAVQPADGL